MMIKIFLKCVSAMVAVPVILGLTSASNARISLKVVDLAMIMMMIMMKLMVKMKNGGGNGEDSDNNDVTHFLLLMMFTSFQL